MKRHSRRDFVRMTAASAGAVGMAACGEPPDRSELQARAVERSRALPTEVLHLELGEKVDRNMRLCHHCAQSSFLALQQQFELDGGPIVKALTPMPGIAERGETCGAVTGCLMALGLVFGRDRLSDFDAFRQSLIPAQAFCRRFEEEMGSTHCGDILEREFGRRFDLTDPEDLAAFQSRDATEVCSGVVRTGVRHAADVLLEHA